jgi:Flp pilus assembly protein TadG
MILPRRVAAGVRNESGAVLVMFALFAPVALMFFAFVADAGNSWLHHRHLQVQADAAALAAAQEFQPCSNPAVTAEAQKYGGVSGNPDLYNVQIGGTSPSNIHQQLNSRTFYGQITPVDSSVNTAAPCTGMMADVKMTETNLPWWLGGVAGILTGTPYINAQARVEIHQETTLGPGTVPVAVNDLSPKAAEAFFIDESSGTVLGSVPLTPQGTSNGLSMWSSGASPYSLTVPSGPRSDVGVRIALSGANNLTGSMSTDCAASSVICYDSSSSSVQLLDVHGWSAGGTGTLSSPIPRQVVMTPGACDQYYTASASNCSDGVKANIDFGPSPDLSKVTVNAVVGKSAYPLTCSYDSNLKVTVCTGNVQVTAGSGRNQVDITVKRGSSTVTFSDAQSTYAAALNGNAGPIQTLGLYENGIGDTSSLQQGTTHSLVVNMGITGSLAVAQSVSDPIYTMRFNGTGSQNQSVGCTAANGGTNFWQMLAYGCAGSYQINPTLTCPDNNTPIDCVPPQTGNEENQVAKGINQRVLGSTQPATCTAPNHWADYQSPGLSESDPRIVSVFVTPYGSFGGNGGSSQFPISNFATFYITGWQDSGNGFNNPCQGHGDDPAQPGTIVGHFIKYINTLGTGEGGTMCDPDSLGQCVAVLTR